jgi:hypothetical protein
MISFARKMISERMHFLSFGFHRSIFSEGRVNCGVWFVRSIERNSQQERLCTFPFA